MTVNLAPADLPKDSGRFDLPIALGILAASGQIGSARLDGWEFAGELSLGGELRPVRGALAMSLALHRAGELATGPSSPTRLVLPPGSAEEAALVPEAEVFRARHLLDVVAQFLPDAGQGRGQGDGPAESDGWARMETRFESQTVAYADMADVKGQAAAKRALEIAAAGGHSLLLMGPPGSGKSMLAQRFAGLLPPMNTGEALESAAVASLAGRFTIDRWGQRPTCAPHHSASAVALVGGGSPPRPGEISLAHQGVLFLDEFGVPEGGPGSLARTPRKRNDTNFAGGHAKRIPGSFPVGGGHECLPLWFPGSPHARLPMHARSDITLPGKAQWPFA